MRFLGFRLFLISMLVLAGQSVAFGAGLVSLSGHVPSAKAIGRAKDLGRKSGSSRMNLAISLKTKDPDGLIDLVRGLYDPTDSRFHRFIQPAQFADNYAMSSDDVAQITGYLKSKGLNVLKTHPNHLVIDVEGATSTIENAFQIEMHEYVAADGRIVHAPTTEPILSSGIAPKLIGISGLNNFRHVKPHLQKSSKKISPRDVPSSGLTPTEIKTAYNLNGVSQNGAGQSIALVEFDAFTPSDVTTYASQTGLPAPSITVVPVDGGTTLGSGADEVTLDIELVAALAPGLSNIYVYESHVDNTLDVYSQIASDNTAQIVSTSWGDAENDEDATDFNYLSEQYSFLEMVSQGQTVFAAAGDNGAYDDSDNNINTLQVDDPGSQLYVTSVGGTSLATNTDGTYLFESSWNDAEGAGGGGISRHFNIPAWQAGLATSGNLGSNSNRMVPDVSLNADPETGYAIYYDNSWSVYGGTSCAAPLWAAFTALVNQQRATNTLTTIGFLNPSIYAIGTGIYYANGFNDVNDGSTNLYYPATTGYDLSTGWGSFNGAGLFTLLTTQTVSPGPSPSASAFAPPSIPTGLSAQVYQ